MPGLRPRPGAGAGDGPMRAVLAAVPRMRRTDPVPRRARVPAVPEARRAGRREVDVPALRQARLSAGGDRLVRVVFTPRPTEGSAPHLCGCGELRRHAGRGMCGRCWQRHPDRPFVRGENLLARLAEPPDWLDDFVAHLAARHCPARACAADHHAGSAARRRAPQSSAERARTGPPPWPVDGIAGPGTGDVLHRPWVGDGHRSGRATGGRAATEADRRHTGAHARCGLRVRRFHAARPRPCPPCRYPPARPTTPSRQRLAIVRDLARFLDSQRGKQDWALVDVSDIEAFLAEQPNNRARRLTVLGQFFRFARNRRVVLVDPTRGLAAKRYRGFRGSTLTITQQRGTVSALDHRSRGAPARGARRAPGDVARRLQQRAAPAAGRPHRRQRLHDPTRQAPPPGAAGPGQLDRAATLPWTTATPGAPTTRTSSSPAAPRPTAARHRRPT